MTEFGETKTTPEDQTENEQETRAENDLPEEGGAEAGSEGLRVDRFEDDPGSGRFGFSEESDVNAADALLTEHADVGSPGTAESQSGSGEHGLGEQLREAAEKIGEFGSDLGDRISNSFEQLSQNEDVQRIRENAANEAEKLGEKASDALDRFTDSITDKAESTYESLKDLIQGGDETKK